MDAGHERRCLSCFRTERDGEVLAPGGARRPPGPPERAAWDVIATSLRGEVPPVVGVCAACGQPMVGEGTPIAWSIPVEGGALRLEPDGALTGPAGRLAPDEAERWVARTYAEPPVPLSERALGVFQAGLFGALLIPLALAVFMVVFVFWYLANLGAPA